MLFVSMLAAGCHGRGEKQEVVFHRFEQLLFDTPPERLQSALERELPTYSSGLLNVHPEDERYMLMLTDFVGDTVMRNIYNTTDSLYHNLDWLEDELGAALRRAERLCPHIHYSQFYTLITGDYQDYQNRVFCDDHSLAISIDHYAVGSMPQYQYFGMPSYLLALCTPEHLATDCMAAIARAHIALPEGDMTLLDYALAEGKALYFVEQVMPRVADTLLLRYTADQLRWMERNVAQVWAWLIQNKMLYCSDVAQLRNIVDDAPKTNAFGEGSAPRTPAYIGWQIVKQYVKRSHCSMSELLEDTDSQKILTESGWRP